MSDLAYGARSGGEQEGGSSNVSEQNVSTPQVSQPERMEQQGNEQVTLTKKDMEVWAQRIKDEAIQEATKRAQSMTDKMGSRLDKEIQVALETAKQSIELGKQAGIQYTPEQEQAIRDKAINSAYAKLNQPEVSPPQDSAVPQAQHTGQDQGQQSIDPSWQWVNQEVHRIMNETGVYISGEEANKMILGEDGGQGLSPYQYIQAFESLARQRQQNISHPRGPNPAIPSYVQGGKSTESQTALKNAYLKELEQIKSGTHPTIKKGQIKNIQDMENEYRRKGLEF